MIKKNTNKTEEQIRREVFASYIKKVKGDKYHTKKFKEHCTKLAELIMKGALK